MNKDNWDNEWVDPWRFEDYLNKIFKQAMSQDPSIKKYLKDHKLQAVVIVKDSVVRNI